MVDDFYDVRTFLASGAIDKELIPKNLIKIQKEEMKRAFEDSDSNYEACFTSLPMGIKFVRFAKLPKDIVF